MVMHYEEYEDIMGERDGINRKRLIGTFIELIKINSPSYGEEAIGEALSGKLRALGCNVRRQGYGSSFNLMGFVKGTIRKAPTLILSAHMDTIEATKGIAFSMKNGIIRSTGSTVLGADDKGAIAQILEALTALKEKDTAHGNIEIVFTSAEERGLFGAKHLDFKRIKGRHALVLDSSGRVGKIVVAAPSHITYEMRITGRPAHAGMEPEKGISAIKAAAAIIAKVPDGRIDGETTANIGVIEGGTATNVVSKEVVMRGEVRSHNPVRLRSLRDAIFNAAKSVARQRNAKIQIKEQKEYQSFRISEGEPFLLFMDRVFEKCGIRAEHTVTGGGSDANIFNRKGVRTLNISTGMQKVHSHEEFIRIDDLYNGSLVVLQAIKDFGRFGKGVF
jgi:tripeptide aminopeptidase